MDRVPRLWRKTSSRDPEAELRGLQERFRTIRSNASKSGFHVAEIPTPSSVHSPEIDAAEDETPIGPWTLPPFNSDELPNRAFGGYSAPSKKAAKKTLPIHKLVYATVMGGVVGFAVVALAVTFSG